jgi:S-DNA-T family DNA segregation ATPase FtsK/SpoIIIE
MRFLGPTRHARLNEAGAVVFLIAGLFLFFSLISYYPLDSSWNTAASSAKPVNLTGLVGASISDLLLQGFGLGAYAVPILVLMLAWQWMRGIEIAAPWARIVGGFAWVGATCTALGFFKEWHPIADAIPAGGLIGGVMADYLMSAMNLTGAVLVTFAVWILSLYLVSTFEMSRLPAWFHPPIQGIGKVSAQLMIWRARWKERAQQRAQVRAAERAARAEQMAALAAADALGERAAELLQEQSPHISDPLLPSAAAAAASAHVSFAPQPKPAPSPLPASLPASARTATARHGVHRADRTRTRKGTFRTPARPAARQASLRIQAAFDRTAAGARWPRRLG